MAERLAGDNDKLRRLIRNIRHAAERGEALTKQLLAFSRRQTLRPEIVDICQQVQLIAELLGRSLRDDIELAVDLPPDLWAVEVDPSQLELALLNVGLNARDAMPRGGTLRLAARNVVSSGQIARLSGNYVAVSVTDTGTGIPHDIRSRIFEPFFTTKGSGKGSGLGLSQAYGFATQSGGAITVDSEPGKGTTVEFYLPARPAGRPLPVASKPAETVQAETKGNVLLVEDDPAIAELATDLLDEAGYRVEVVGDADSALEALRSGARRVDAVFSDIMMPGGMNGAELAQVIRRDYPHIPILLTTGYAEAAAGAALNGFPLIGKPYESKVLIRALARLLASPRPADA
jgi:two-component system NtrC family sensor kinase